MHPLLLTFFEFLGRPPGFTPLPPGGGSTRCRSPFLVLPVGYGPELLSSSFPHAFVQIILLQQGHCTFVIILFGPFTWLFINLTMCIRALFSQICNHSWSCRKSFLEGATFHRMNSCKFLQGNPCHSIETFYHWDFFLWDFVVLDAFLSLCCMKEFEDGFGCIIFCTLVNIVTESAIVSFRTLPVSFPLPTISNNSLSTLFGSPDS